ncbi:hypothetical protein BASA50_007443 [Batrachochytrium salamandrivorans]|uniref:Uncharacterized protein n=1 Tax=Batrachochytrium salamandrivorans TaxID=1357716 RepID=A0ABQ8F9Y5_9FUNG|nr:hypothetical protein BASA50_007443 [Batrachochytrium salamandrivorans]KAH9247406.1 hypothetical protein BASA81_015000 [Batrachochytrium salamandrivorans]
MQFFHLFSFVVAASYAVALPQPAGLSEKYSNSVDTNLASGLEARSYQPGLDSYKESAILMSLERRDDSEKSPEEDSGSDDSEGSPEEDSGSDDSEGSPEEDSGSDDSEGSPEEDSGSDDSEGSPEEDSGSDDSEGSSEENSGSDSSPPPATTPDHSRWEPNGVLSKAERGALFLFYTIEEVGDNLADTPENVKAAGAAIDGNAGDTLVEYLRRALYVSAELNKWAEDTGKNLVLVIKSGLGDEEYSKVESSLDDASEKLAADASDNLQQVTAALLNIENKVDSAKLELDAVQQAFGRVFEAYESYVEVLKPHLDKFRTGRNLNGYLSDGVGSLVEFSQKQEALYYTVRNGLKDAPSE